MTEGHEREAMQSVHNGAASKVAAQHEQQHEQQQMFCHAFNTAAALHAGVRIAQGFCAPWMTAYAACL